jgi:hypothetical protein
VTDDVSDNERDDVGLLDPERVIPVASDLKATDPRVCR